MILGKRRERKRLALVRDRALEGACGEATELAQDIMETAASFGTDRLFDERLRRIENRASRIKARSSEALLYEGPK